MEKTLEQYDAVMAKCKALFEHKMHDYGAAWRILRLPSLTDQIYIKANRIRTLQETAERLVNEDEAGEFVGIVNYSIIALIQIKLGVVEQPDINTHKSLELFNEQANIARDLMQKKNHDYGEAWRDMRISSITDLILQKLLRIKQIENIDGKTKVSEGLDANYLDLVNYAVFALILISESKPS